MPLAICNSRYYRLAEKIRVARWQRHLASESDAQAVKMHNKVLNLCADRNRNAWVFVQLIHKPTRTENQLYKNPNIP